MLQDVEIITTPLSLLGDKSMVWLCQQMTCQGWFEVLNMGSMKYKYYMTDQMNNATYVIPADVTTIKPHLSSYDYTLWIAFLALWIMWIAFGCFFIKRNYIYDTP